MTKAVDTRYTQERELSWLKFNESHKNTKKMKI